MAIVVICSGVAVCIFCWIACWYSFGVMGGRLVVFVVFCQVVSFLVPSQSRRSSCCFVLRVSAFLAPVKSVNAYGVSLWGALNRSCCACLMRAWTAAASSFVLNSWVFLVCLYSSMASWMYPRNFFLLYSSSQSKPATAQLYGPSSSPAWTLISFIPILVYWCCVSAMKSPPIPCPLCVSSIASSSW